MCETLDKCVQLWTNAYKYVQECTNTSSESHDFRCVRLQSVSLWKRMFPFLRESFKISPTCDIFVTDVRPESVRDFIPLEKQTFWQMVIFDLDRPAQCLVWPFLVIFVHFKFTSNSNPTPTKLLMNRKKWFWWWKAGGEWFSTIWNYNWHIWHCHWQFWKLFHHSCIHQVRYST